MRHCVGVESCLILKMFNVVESSLCVCDMVVFNLFKRIFGVEVFANNLWMSLKQELIISKKIDLKFRKM